MQDKVTLLREKWAEALESGKYEQYRGSYFPMDNGIFDRDSNLMCVTAVLWRVSKALGFKHQIIDMTKVVNVQQGMIEVDNDGGLSFLEIAAKLRNGDYDK